MFEMLGWEIGALLGGILGGHGSGYSSSSSENPIKTVRQMGEQFINISMLYGNEYSPNFKALGCSEAEADIFALIIIKAKKAGLDIIKSNLDKISTVSGYDTDTVDNAIIKYLLDEFLTKEKGMTRADLRTVYTVQEALYRDDKKRDLDDVSKDTGIPLDVVRNIDNMMEEFLSKWSVGNPQAPTNNGGGTQKKKPPKTKPITVDDPNGSQGSPTP